MIRTEIYNICQRCHLQLWLSIISTQRGTRLKFKPEVHLRKLCNMRKDIIILIRKNVQNKSYLIHLYKASRITDKKQVYLCLSLEEYKYLIYIFLSYHVLRRRRMPLWIVPVHRMDYNKNATNSCLATTAVSDEVFTLSLVGLAVFLLLLFLLFLITIRLALKAKTRRLERMECEWNQVKQNLIRSDCSSGGGLYNLQSYIYQYDLRMWGHFWKAIASSKLHLRLKQELYRCLAAYCIMTYFLTLHSISAPLSLI